MLVRESEVNAVKDVARAKMLAMDAMAVSIAAGIALVIIAIVAAVGTDLGTLFGTVDTNLTGHGG